VVTAPVRALAITLACLVPGGMAASQEPPGRAAATPGAAWVVAVLPPEAVVWEQGATTRVREDWSAATYRSLASALQAALEGRGLQVAWIHKTPQAAAFIDDLVESLVATQAIRVSIALGQASAADRRFDEHERRFRQKVLSLLLRTLGARLLVVSHAEGLAAPSGSITSLTVLVVEPGGDVVHEGVGSIGLATLEEGVGAGSLVREALEGLPRLTHDKAFGEKCVFSAECQPGLYCPYGRCLRGEEPAPPR
jgi:hypothetical protein